LTLKGIGSDWWEILLSKDSINLFRREQKHFLPGKFVKASGSELVWRTQRDNAGASVQPPKHPADVCAGIVASSRELIQTDLLLPFLE